MDASEHAQTSVKRGETAEPTLPKLLRAFMETVTPDRVYNEFSLQHELGIYLRAKLPDFQTEFERNVSRFFDSKYPFVKREIDIVSYSESLRALRSAVELKFPRNGQVPETMFSFCKDIAFIEQLKQQGFDSTALVILVDDAAFYKGGTNGIYGYFRAGHPLHGTIQKPTGKRDDQVHIQGTYDVQWKHLAHGLSCSIVIAQ